ncbi:MAG: ABC transporter permease [Thermodesulfovibrionales bacterium]|nr:ABC transporter permease [Thermodesulfovibrionales bacterium]
MKLIKGTRIAFKALFSHKLRTALAMTGIVVGVCSVIVMVAVGDGAQKQVLSKIRAMGTDLVIVTAGQVKIIAGRQRQTGNVTTLTTRDIKAITEEAQNIKAAAPAQSKKMLVKYEAFNTTTSIIGTTEAIIPVRDLSLGRGRFFSDDEDKTSLRVAVIGETVARNLFENRNPLGESVRIGKVSFEIIGVLGKKGTDLVGADQDDVIYIPINTALRRLFNLTYINNIYVQAKSSQHIEKAASEIRDILREKHRLRDKPDDFTIQSQTEILKSEKETTQTFTNLLSTVAGISLLVGGVGILAIMLISIKERTREIGLRRAVGALKRDLLLQFIVESLVLSASGGIVGILLGVALSLSASYFTKWSLSLSLPAILIAFLFSAVIGLIFGVYPAAKAARLDPIEALRAE